MTEADLATASRPELPPPKAAGAQVEIVVPVRNEERDLAPGIRRLCRYLRLSFPFTTRVTIADNGSSDGTWAVATALRDEFAEVSAVRLAEPGRGRALRAIWSASGAEILAYMDVDMSTDLNALLPLVAPLVSRHSDVAIGTRLARGSRVVRGPRREVISRGYNLLLHATLRAGFSDAQCGFKAIRREHAAALLPLTTDDGWFFDTELLILAERAGLRIHEVPVDWIDDLDSRVDVLATAVADVRGIIRLGTSLARGAVQVPELRHASRWVPGGPGDTDEAGQSAARPRSLPRQAVRFLIIGIASTLAYVVLYLLLRTAIPAQPANAITLLITAVANTAANRRITFGIRGRAHAARHQFRGLIAFAAGLALTSGSLAALHAASPSPGRAAEVTVLVAANLVATVLRFVLYRTWVFGIGRRQHPRPTSWRDRGRRRMGAGRPTERRSSAHAPPAARRSPVGVSAAPGTAPVNGQAAGGVRTPDRRSASPPAYGRRPSPSRQLPERRVPFSKGHAAPAVMPNRRFQ